MKNAQGIQSALEQYQAGNFEQAETICKEILEGRPGDTEVLHLMGLIYNKLGNHDSAMEYIKKAIKFNPVDADLYYDLGNILQENGERTKAVTNYKKAIKFNPRHFEAYNNMGIALHDNMQLDEAIKSYRKAIKIDPGYAEAYNNLGVAFQEKKQLDDAITHFQKALLLRPGYQNAYHNLVEAVQGKGYSSKQKPARNTVYAVYHCLIGEDFIQDSIGSINSLADKIFVFRDNAPYGKVSKLMYQGKRVSFPKKFDGVEEKIRELNNPKIELMHDHWNTAENRLTHFVNDRILPGHEKPDVIVFLEPDQVFRNDQLEKALDEFIMSEYVLATTATVEVWRGFRHRLPERQNKTGAIFCNLSHLKKMPDTLRHGGLLVMPRLSAFVHDFGFAVSEKTMYWKHLLSLAYAEKSGEPLPSENWYEEKWLRWDYESNNINLDISEKEKIPDVIPYDMDELPELIRKRFGSANV